MSLMFLSKAKLRMMRGTIDMVNCICLNDFERKDHITEVEKTLLRKNYTNLKKLESMAGLSHYRMCKLSANKDVTTDVCGAICTALGMELNEIMNFIPDKEN
jgi:DNA-binding Xre family transcriptional regulator